MDLGGDLVADFIELLSILITKGIELLTTGIIFLFNRYVFKSRRKGLVKKIERKELSCRKITKDESALGYSITKKKVLFMEEVDKKKHTLVCGASGFGKTVLLDTLIYDDVQRKKPIIFIDPKGDNKSLRQFINLCRIRGRDFAVFSEYYNGPGSIALNPAKDGSATHIADRIHHAFNWSEEHYETLCYRALKAACDLILEGRGVVSYPSILDKLVSISEPTNKAKLFERKNIEGIIARLENIVHSDFGPKLKDDGLSLRDVWESRKCVYIGIPVLGYPKIARSLGKMILGDLAFAVYDAYKHTTVSNENSFWPVGVYIDELSAVITDEFIELLNKCRGVKMEVNFAFQSPSDINKISPQLCEQIMENSANWFILKQRIESGANTFAESIGTTQGTKQTVRFADGQKLAQGSQRTVEELVAHHNIIKNLNRGQAILLRHSPTQVDLINIKYIDPAIAQFNVELLERDGWIQPLPRKRPRKKSVAWEHEDDGPHWGQER